MRIKLKKKKRNEKNDLRKINANVNLKNDADLEKLTHYNNTM